MFGNIKCQSDERETSVVGIFSTSDTVGTSKPELPSNRYILLLIPRIIEFKVKIPNFMGIKIYQKFETLVIDYR